MGKNYFPLFIDLTKKKIVVIGGGVIATRRIQTLLQFTEQIVVVAPQISQNLQELKQLGKIIWLPSVYAKEQILDADMVIAATNDPIVNHQIKKDCKMAETVSGHTIFVSVIDEKELCDFYFPSIVQKDEIVIGINSGGTSPAQTKEMRRKIEAILESESIY